MLIRGRCHCGNIEFSLRWEPGPSRIPARACDCSFCTRHGGVWTSHPDASLRIALHDPARVSRYAFGTRTADFLVCAHCGVVPVAVSRIEGRRYAVVNVNTFVGIEPSLLQRVSSHLGEESRDARLDRRSKNWIADVEYVDEGEWVA
jgi:hypothetical protein